MRKILQAILRDNTAATAIEYGLIASLIVIAIIGALSSFANSANAMFERTDAKITASVNSAP